jgi:hypothetical protein
MLPGFRFLFAAIMLSMSLLIFGLGAAALLRAAHEEVASNPSWRAAPEVTFAQPAEAERPVLATLRVDLPVGEKPQADAPANTAASELAVIAPTPVDTISGPTDAAKAAQSMPVEAAQPDLVKPEIEKSEAFKDEVAVAETTAANEPAAASMEKQAAALEVQVAAGVAAPAADALPPARSELIIAQAAPSTTSGATKIATLGGPPVDIEETPRKIKTRAAPPDQAQDDATEVRKHAHARRASRRRIAALRARLAAQQLAQQQLQLNPFFQQPLQQPLQPPVQQQLAQQLRQPRQQPSQVPPAH